MRIVFVSNFLNHHQRPLCEELFKLTNGEFVFIETEPMEEMRRNLGYQDIDAPYVIKCHNQPTPPPEIAEIIDNADAVIIGSAPDSYIISRTKNNKLTFKYSERLYKEEPSFLKLLYHRLRFRWRYSRNKNCFLLCASAFAANDYRRIGCFKNRAFKWGYFPEVSSVIQNEVSEQSERQSKDIELLWVGRFLKWKHPEIAVLLAEKLNAAGVSFKLNMFGIGPEFDAIRQLIREKELSNCVELQGAVNNGEILKQMRQSDIFLFTSDRKEGWGAVANEAMSNGCVIVASDAIGSTPFLIKDGVNGMIFRDGHVDELFDKVLLLINDSKLRKGLSINAGHTMCDIWSPKNAAKSIVKLIDSFMRGMIEPNEEGPCSKA